MNDLGHQLTVRGYAEEPINTWHFDTLPLRVGPAALSLSLGRLLSCLDQWSIAEVTVGQCQAWPSRGLKPLFRQLEAPKWLVRCPTSLSHCACGSPSLPSGEGEGELTGPSRLLAPAAPLTPRHCRAEASQPCGVFSEVLTHNKRGIIIISNYFKLLSMGPFVTQ